MRPLARHLVFANAVIAVPTTVWAYYTIKDLERRYPLESASSALNTWSERIGFIESRPPPTPSQVFHDRCVFGAHIPESVTTRSFATTLFNQPILRLEARLLGNPPLDPKLRPGTKVFAGEIVESSDDEVVLEWEMDDKVVKFFEKIGKWGYPWRMMSGGRHVVITIDDPARPGCRFAVFGTVHWYEKGKDEKRIPMWVTRLHMVFARYLLDRAVKDVRSEW